MISGVPLVENHEKALQCLLRLVLTDDGTLYSRGVAMYGSTGHGGARDVGALGTPNQRGPNFDLGPWDSHRCVPVFDTLWLCQNSY
jgi:hypothetical protein